MFHLSFFGKSALFIVFVTFLSCKEESIVDNYTPLELTEPIEFEKGMSLMEILQIDVGVYIPEGVGTIQNLPLIVGFAPTSGTHHAMKGFLMELADSLKAILICPQRTNGTEYNYHQLIDSVINTEAVNAKQVYIVGYSNGGAYAFSIANQIGNRFKGAILLAPGGNAGDTYVDNYLPKTCICVGTDDRLYEMNLKFYHRLSDLGKKVYLKQLEGYDHEDMFSRNYTDVILECVNRFE